VRLAIGATQTMLAEQRATLDQARKAAVQADQQMQRVAPLSEWFVKWFGVPLRSSTVELSLGLSENRLAVGGLLTRPPSRSLSPPPVLQPIIERFGRGSQVRSKSGHTEHMFKRAQVAALSPRGAARARPASDAAAGAPPLRASCPRRCNVAERSIRVLTNSRRSQSDKHCRAEM
jgi:hypothetical protein